jgi:Pentapeptide repeats (8 copies)
MSAAPLLQGSAQDMPGLLRITWDGAELKDPNILEVSLVSRGRRDIASEDFDQPLEFRVNARILAILRTASGPNSTAFRAVAFDEDLLKVGPGLIRRHQSIKFTLLASGRDPVLSSSAAAVRDVDVDVLSTERSSRGWSLRVKVLSGLTVAAAMAGLVIIGLVIGRNPPLRAESTAAIHTLRPTSSPHTLGPTSSPHTLEPTPSAVSGLLQAAQTDLNSRSQATQSSGISTLQRVMNSSPGNQPAAIEMLTKFIRTNSPAGNNDQPITFTIQTALNVLIHRNPDDDRGSIINLSNTNLTNANLSGVSLIGASLINADFDSANLNGANLRMADLNYAFVGGASLDGTNLTGANLADASFYQTILCHGSTPTQNQRGYDCSANG